MIRPQSQPTPSAKGSHVAPETKPAGSPHAANDVHSPGTHALSSNPTYFSDQALQTESHFIAQSLIDDDNVMTDSLNSFYTHTLDDGMREMDEASRVTRSAANDAQYAQARTDSVRSENTSQFFNHAAHYATDAGKFAEGFGIGFSDAAIATAEGLENAACHPTKTAMALYATAQDGYHFAHELLHASTRPEALTQLKNDLHNIDHTIASDWTLALHNPEFAGKMVGEGVFVGTSFLVGGEVAGVSKFGMFGDRAVLADQAATTNRLVRSIQRVSSNVANEPFISKKALAAGWKPPYPNNIDIREITLSRETRFARVFTGDDPTGQFLVRYKEIADIAHDPEAIRLHLGLKNIPANITDVYVPPDVRMLVGRIGEQPNFGLMEESGFQYQLLEQIPRSSFRNNRPIYEPENDRFLDFNS